MGHEGLFRKACMHSVKPVYLDYPTARQRLEPTYRSRRCPILMLRPATALPALRHMHGQQRKEVSDAVRWTSYLSQLQAHSSV